MLLFRWYNEIWRHWFWLFLLDRKPYEYILIYDISYKKFVGAKPLSIRFFNKIYDGTRYLKWFGSGIYNAI